MPLNLVSFVGEVTTHVKGESEACQHGPSWLSWKQQCTHEWYKQTLSCVINITLVNVGSSMLTQSVILVPITVYWGEELNKRSSWSVWRLTYEYYLHTTSIYQQYWPATKVLALCYCMRTYEVRFWTIIPRSELSYAGKLLLFSANGHESWANNQNSYKRYRWQWIRIMYHRMEFREHLILMDRLGPSLERAATATTCSQSVKLVSTHKTGLMHIMVEHCTPTCTRP